MQKRWRNYPLWRYFIVHEVFHFVFTVTGCTCIGFRFWIAVSWSETGSVLVVVTNGSGCGSGRPKNIRIRMRVRIRNTAGLIWEVWIKIYLLSFLVWFHSIPSVSDMSSYSADLSRGNEPCPAESWAGGGSPVISNPFRQSRHYLHRSVRRYRMVSNSDPDLDLDPY